MRTFLALMICALLVGPAPTARAADQRTEAPFTKLDDQGKVLAADAPRWAMVRDNRTGLIWEVKTRDGSVHDMGNTYDWKGAHEDFIEELNRSRFGGFTDWRLPTSDELRSIRVKGAEPYINLDFFPKRRPPAICPGASAANETSIMNGSSSARSATQRKTGWSGPCAAISLLRNKPPRLRSPRLWR